MRKFLLFAGIVTLATTTAPGAFAGCDCTIQDTCKSGYSGCKPGAFGGCTEVAGVCTPPDNGRIAGTEIRVDVAGNRIATDDAEYLGCAKVLVATTVTTAEAETLRSTTDRIAI